TLLLSFLFTAPPPTHFYTLSLHDALPICNRRAPAHAAGELGGHLLQRARQLHEFERLLHARQHLAGRTLNRLLILQGVRYVFLRSEEHTSELQSRGHLVCRLLLEKKKKKI